MKHIVCYSGGHSSAIVAMEVVAKFGKDNVILLNHNINPSVELPDVKRFKQAVADYLGLPITYANHPEWDTKDQFDVCIDAGTWVNPNTRTILCTHRLKTEPFYKWLSEHHQAGDVIYYGFDANEHTRITRRSIALGSAGYQVDFPLATWPEADRVFFRTSDAGISKPAQYQFLNHGNCIGCCKAGWQHWYVVYCLYRRIFVKAKWAERNIGYSIHNDGFLEDKEPIFESMRLAGIEPSEKIPSGKFWSTAKKAIRGGQVSLFELPDYEEQTVECIGDCGIDRGAA